MQVYIFDNQHNQLGYDAKLPTASGLLHTNRSLQRTRQCHSEAVSQEATHCRSSLTSTPSTKPMPEQQAHTPPNNRATGHPTKL